MRSLTLAVLLVATVPCRAACASQETVPFKIGSGPVRYPPGTSTTPVVLQFDDEMPAQLEIVRLARSGNDREWRLVETVRAPTTHGRAAVIGPIGIETLLLIRAADHPGYLLDGPFRWPVKPSTYLVRTIWRKTVRGSFGASRGALEWVPADDSAFPPLRCEWAEGTTWECIGVPLNALGIVLMRAGGEVDCGIPAGVLSPSGVDRARTTRTMWGRLIVVSWGGGSPPAEGVRILAKRWHTQQGQEPLLSMRAEVRSDTRVHIAPIADGLAWVSGDDEPQGEAWVEVGARERATERVDMREVTRAPPDMPFRVQLQPAAWLSGTVRNAGGGPATGAVLTLYRLAHDPADPAQMAELRVPVEETTADANGGFHFEDLSIEPYEIVAMHQVFGRGLRRVVPDGREIEIVLRSSGQATGRVLRDGLPASGSVLRCCRNSLSLRPRRR